MPPLPQSTTLSVVCLAATALTGAACASAPTFTPGSPQARVERLTPFSPQRLRPHPGALAGDLASADPSRHAHPGPGERHLARSPAQATAYLWWRAYSATYSRVDGASCNFSPSCSRFGLDAVEEGPLGVVWTFGRLLRDQRPDAFYALAPGGKLIDPVEAYTVWGDDPTLDRSPYAEFPHHGWYLFVQAQRSGLADDLLQRHRAADTGAEPDAGKR